MIASLATSIERLKRTTGASNNCGWMCDEVAFLLYGIVKFYKPQLVIQTGHLWGKSACAVLEAMTDGFLSGRGGLEVEYQNADRKFAQFVQERTPLTSTPPRMISIDPEPMGVAHASAGIELLRRQYPGQFDFYKMASAQFFEEFSEDVSHLRVMGIVDGDHSPQGCLLDLENFGRLKCELILVDDTNWLPQLKTVAQRFAQERGYNFLNLELYNGVGLLTRQR